MPPRAVRAEQAAPALPDFSDVQRAAARLAGLARRTPVLTSRAADALAGATLFFKAENFQRSGSFKFRGAANAIACLRPDARARGVVAYSSGNHAQAVAKAASLAGIRAVVVMPHDALPPKRAAAEGYGAEIIGYDRASEDRQAIAERIAARDGLSLIPPFDHADVVAGQGTAAAELFADTGALDALLVCVGGGGLLAGAALAAHALAPACRVLGVEPAAGNDVQQSLAQGRRVKIPVPASIADGALTTEVGAIPFAILQRLAPAIITVQDDALRAAMRFFAERMKIIVEPTGCLAAAAAFTRAAGLDGQRVGVILSGGNRAFP